MIYNCLLFLILSIHNTSLLDILCKLFSLLMQHKFLLDMLYMMFSLQRLDIFLLDNTHRNWMH